MNSFQAIAYEALADTESKYTVYLNKLTKHSITSIVVNQTTLKHVKNVQLYIGERFVCTYSLATAEDCVLKMPKCGCLPIRYPDFCDYRLVFQYTASPGEKVLVPEFTFTVAVNERTTIPSYNDGRTEICLNDYIPDQFVDSIVFKNPPPKHLQKIVIRTDTFVFCTLNVSETTTVLPVGLPIQAAIHTKFYAQFEWVDEAPSSTPELEFVVRVGPALYCSTFCNRLSPIPPSTPKFIQLNEIVLIDHPPPSNYDCGTGCDPCPGSTDNQRFVRNCIVFDGQYAYKRFTSSKCECKERMGSAKKFIEVLDMYFPPQQK